MSLISLPINGNDRFSLMLFTVLGSRCLATMQSYADIMQVPTSKLAENLVKKVANPVLDKYPIISFCIIDKENNTIAYRYLADTNFTDNDVRSVINHLLLRMERVYLSKARARANKAAKFTVIYQYESVNLADLSASMVAQIQKDTTADINVSSLVMSILQDLGKISLTKSAAM